MRARKQLEKELALLAEEVCFATFPVLSVILSSHVHADEEELMMMLKIVQL
jgi:hypothetical protein